MIPLLSEGFAGRFLFLFLVTAFFAGFGVSSLMSQVSAIKTQNQGLVTVAKVVLNIALLLIFYFIQSFMDVKIDVFSFRLTIALPVVLTFVLGIWTFIFLKKKGSLVEEKK